MARFDPAYDKLLELEGGFVDHAADPGGATNLGISIRYLRQRGDLDGDGLLDGDLDGDGDIDIDDIRQVNKANAKHLYHTGFWAPNRLSEIADQEVATKIFDMVVNMGSRQGWRLVQAALNKLGSDLVVDGLIGPATLAAIADTPNPPLADAIREEQGAFYERLIAARPQFEAFRNGWANRAAA